MSDDRKKDQEIVSRGALALKWRLKILWTPRSSHIEMTFAIGITLAGKVSAKIRDSLVFSRENRK